MSDSVVAGGPLHRLTQGDSRKWWFSCQRCGFKSHGEGSVVFERDERCGYAHPKLLTGWIVEHPKDKPESNGSP